MKFKIGDVVLITKIDELKFKDWKRYEGKIGIIKGVKRTYPNTDTINPWPYEISIDNSGLISFSENELTLATKQTKVLFGDSNG